MSAGLVRTLQACTTPIAALAIVLGSAAATAAPDVEAKIAPAALNFIAAELPAVLPTQFSHPGATKEIWDCPFTSNDVDGTLSGLKANIKVSKVVITPASGKLTVGLTASGSGSGTGRIQVCFGPSVTCNITLNVYKTTASATFSPTMSNGRVSVGTPQVSATLNESDFSLRLSGCGIAADIGNAFISHFKGTVRDWIKNTALGIARDNLDDALNPTLNSFTAWSGAAGGFSFGAQLEKVAVASSGVVVGGGLTISANERAGCTLPAAPKPPATSNSAPLAINGEHVGVALSRTAISEAVIAAWKSGLLCFSGEELGGLDKAGSFIGILFGLQSTESVSAMAPKPPTVELIAGDGGKVKITAAGFTLTIKGSGPLGPVTITATADVVARAQAALDGITGGVVLEKVEPELLNVSLKSSNPQGLNLSTELLEQLLIDTAQPVIASKLQGVPLAARVYNRQDGLLKPYYLYLARGLTTTTHVQLFAKLFKKPSSDSSAPNTSFEKTPPAVVKGGPLTIVARGSDDKTPAELLRYSWRVNSGSWSASAYGRGRTLELKAGKYTVEVRAEDLNGNKDASPAKASFDVDATPPKIEVQAPPEVVTETAIVIPFSVSDDRDPAAEIGVQLHVEYKPEGGAATELRDDPFRKGLDSVSLQNLKPGSYFISLTARDRVGNMSAPAMVNFTVENEPTGSGPAAPAATMIDDPAAGPQVVANGPGGDDQVNVVGGCSAAGPGPAAPLFVLLALALLGVRRRRAR